MPRPAAAVRCGTECSAATPACCFPGGKTELAAVTRRRSFGERDATHGGELKDRVRLDYSYSNLHILETRDGIPQGC